MDVTTDNYSQAKKMIIETILPKVSSSTSRLNSSPTIWNSQE